MSNTQQHDINLDPSWVLGSVYADLAADLNRTVVRHPFVAGRKSYLIFNDLLSNFPLVVLVMTYKVVMSLEFARRRQERKVMAVYLEVTETMRLVCDM